MSCLGPRDSGIWPFVRPWPNDGLAVGKLLHHSEDRVSVSIVPPPDGQDGYPDAGVVLAHRPVPPVRVVSLLPQPLPCPGVGGQLQPLLPLLLPVEAIAVGGVGRSRVPSVHRR